MRHVNEFLSYCCLLLLAMSLASCGNSVSEKRTWSQSTAAPYDFEFWLGSGMNFTLPVQRDQFTKVATSLGGKFYVLGEDAAYSVGVPAPRKGSPCIKTARAIIVDFPQVQPREMPNYVAYMDEGNLIQCVEKRFSYTG